MKKHALHPYKDCQPLTSTPYHLTNQLTHKPQNHPAHSPSPPHPPSSILPYPQPSPPNQPASPPSHYCHCIIPSDQSLLHARRDIFRGYISKPASQPVAVRRHGNRESSCLAKVKSVYACFPSQEHCCCVIIWYWRFGRLEWRDSFIYRVSLMCLCYSFCGGLRVYIFG